MTADNHPERTHGAGSDIDADLPPPPDFDENPAIIDAHRIFLVTLVSTVLFVAAVISFVL